MARASPSTAETTKAAAVMARVTRSDGKSVPQSVTTVRAIRIGPGRIYGGMPCPRTTPSQAPRATRPTRAGARTRLLGRIVGEVIVVDPHPCPLPRQGEGVGAIPSPPEGERA